MNRYKTTFERTRAIYKLYTEERMTLEEIARLFGLTKQRISQLIKWYKREAGVKDGVE